MDDTQHTNFHDEELDGATYAIEPLPPTIDVREDVKTEHTTTTHNPPFPPAFPNALPRPAVLGFARAHQYTKVTAGLRFASSSGMADN